MTMQHSDRWIGSERRLSDGWRREFFARRPTTAKIDDPVPGGEAVAGGLPAVDVVEPGMRESPAPPVEEPAITSSSLRR